jgi:hypothetical protein
MAHEHADTAHSLALLRASRERPRRGCNEIASLHAQAQDPALVLNSSIKTGQSLYGLNPDSLPSAFCQDDVAFPRAAAWGGCGGKITMTEVLNEVDLGEPDQSAPSSDIALSVSGSQKITPSPSALEDRDRRYELRAQQSLTAAFFGDPPPGRSALDRRRAEQERIARQSDVWR